MFWFTRMKREGGREGSGREQKVGEQEEEKEEEKIHLRPLSPFPSLLSEVAAATVNLYDKLGQGLVWWWGLRGKK